jgi:RNA-binding protein
MLSLGKVMHVTRRGLVLRSGEPLEPGHPVYDEGQRRVGSVLDVFGPVSNPYIAIKPAHSLTNEDLAALVGKGLYIMGERNGGRKARKEAHMPRMRQHKARSRL